MDIAGYTTHPAADVFPLLEGKDFAALVENIRTNGLNEPISVVGELILDGRNRLRACIAAKVEPRFRQHEGDPWEFAWSSNVERRHLEPGSRAAFRLKWNKERGRWEESRRARKTDADKARRANAKPGPGRGKEKVDNNVVADRSSRDREKEARSSLAKDASVSPSTAQKAITVADKSPVLFEKVVAGQVTLNRAYRDTTRRLITEKIALEPAPLPTGPFRTIVADPPWPYETRNEDPSHRGVTPYPPMSIETICMLGIEDLAAPDAVLWLWTTNAFMDEAFDVAKAWGFTQKTILTWCKPKMGAGNWLRNQTEHCLVAVRGKPTVTLTNQTTIIQGPVREHSRKPETFYVLVESLCPGSKVELYAREPREGWARWGAESEKFAGAAE